VKSYSLLLKRQLHAPCGGASEKFYQAEFGFINQGMTHRIRLGSSIPCRIPLGGALFDQRSHNGRAERRRSRSRKGARAPRWRTVPTGPLSEPCCDNRRREVRGMGRRAGINAERAAMMDFSAPYTEVEQGYLVHAGVPTATSPRSKGRASAGNLRSTQMMLSR
jgi:hypothetical protein